jgi:ABC-2 type transport system ATP-binding protein
MGSVITDATPQAAQPAVRARSAGYRYKSGKVALQPTELTIEQGTIVGLIGPNGAGKSTLLKLIATALRPTLGTIDVLGTQSPAQVRKNLGYLPDEAALFDELSALEQLALIARIRHTRADPAALLAELGFDLADANNRSFTYSFGMRRKVALAQALIGDPRLLVLDEPTIGLDADARERAASALRTRATTGATGATGSTALLSTNDLAFAELVCDRVVLLNEGKLVLEGAPAQLLQDMRASASYRVQTAEKLVQIELPPGFAFEAVDVRTGIFRTATGGSLSELVSALDRVGNRVTSLEVHRADLSDVFRVATGLNWTPPSEAAE